jgi:transcriptional regulator with XRE-family HTH domain
MSDVKKEIGERLKSVRERRGLKQNKVALHLGVHNSTLAKYESGEREPDNETLMKLAEYYEVNTDWILSGETKLINDPAKNAVMEAYFRLPQDKKKIIDEIIKSFDND